MLKKHRVLFTIITIVLIAIVGIAAIFYARGFKPNIRTGAIGRTGLIVASSIPTGAQVYVDDRLSAATDSNITYLDPKKYQVKIQKDGYTTWQKEVEVKEDLATEVKALLFPLAPEIKPLTTTGATNPVMSPDNQKIVYGVSGPRGGVYILQMESRPFPFRQDTKLLAKNTTAFDFAKATYIWNPNSGELIAHFEGVPTANILLDANKTEQDLRDITASLTSTLNSYEQDYQTRTQTLAITAPDEVKSATAEAQFSVESQSEKSKSANPSPSPKTKTPVNSTLSTLTLTPNPYPTGMMYSPDEEKILYQNRDKQYKVYDLKTKKEYTLPNFDNFINIAWYPDSEHLVVTQNGAISIIEKDGTNKVTVFSGKFEGGSVFTHPSGTRIIVLSTLFQPEGSAPNLYSINLR
ncbi:MAG TPA: PEGA domain-containing protein [Candidatus Saccharimonadales bacterium]|nr:PEGA domain-containing protein [Candidatus Saccharimonadales bacterium]